MTCQEIEELLDLLAAGECDPATREAMESHLRQCDTCAAKFAESQRVQGLLDVQLNQGGLERLQQRISEHAQPRRQARLVGPFLRRAGLVAALVLIAIGLIWWIPRDPGGKAPPEFALLVRGEKIDVEVEMKTPANLAKDAAAVVVIQKPARAVDLKSELMQAERDGKLPLATAAPLELTLVNNSDQSVEIKLGDANAKLSYEISGQGVLRFAAPKAELPAPLRAQTLQMEPGKSLVFHIDRLVAGSPGKLENLYLTQPGEFMLTPNLRLTADGHAVTVKGETVRIKVEHQGP